MFVPGGEVPVQNQIPEVESIYTWATWEKKQERSFIY